MQGPRTELDDLLQLVLGLLTALDVVKLDDLAAVLGALKLVDARAELDRAGLLHDEDGDGREAWAATRPCARVSRQQLAQETRKQTKANAPNHLIPVPTAYQNERPVNQPSFFSSTTTCTGSAPFPPWFASSAAPSSAGGV